jgi:MFS family permease
MGDIMDKKYFRTKAACYVSNISGAVMCTLPPLLFITFRELYGISYTLLGTLVLINFVTQLTIDLIFSFFSHKFNIPVVIKLMPLLTVMGMIVYALAPVLFPNSVYVGLALGTVIFSVSGGLGEVLISPIIAAIPSDDPDREMSKLHSIFAWGCVGIAIVCTAFLFALSGTYWQILTVVLALVPLSAAILYMRAPLPEMQTPERASGAFGLFKNKALWLCFLSIFLGGAAECTMSQWCSGYVEKALGIPKIWGDIFGVALFAAALGLGRSLYAKYGKNIEKMLFFGSIGAALCYAVAVFSGVPIVGLISCAFTGFCVSMLWPGSLIAVADRIPTGGVVMYAVMAAGGDLGASVGPQLVGIVSDAVGIRLGLLAGMVFPVLGIGVNLILLRQRVKKDKISEIGK